MNYLVCFYKVIFKPFLWEGLVGFALLFSSCVRAAEPDSATSTRIVVSGQVDGYDYVDVGLPVLWATANVGAKKPSDEGMLVAWGEQLPNGEYDWHSYKYSGDSCNSLTKYCLLRNCGTVDSLTCLTLEDDAAASNWSGSWRIPTGEDFNALRMCCAWQWVDDFDSTGVCGLYGVSRLNGNTIFFPATEFEESREDERTYFQGWYWSASLGSGEQGTALQFTFKKGGKMEDIGMQAVPRCFGRLIRPVTTKKTTK